MTELSRIIKMTLRVIFSILNNLSLRRNINLNIRNSQGQTNLFSGKSELQMFFRISGRHACAPQRDTKMASKLYKFMWNILSNKSSTECRTDLTLGQMPYLFILYTMSIS